MASRALWAESLLQTSLLHDHALFRNYARSAVHRRTVVHITKLRELIQFSNCLIHSYFFLFRALF